MRAGIRRLRFGATLAGVALVLALSGTATAQDVQRGLVTQETYAKATQAQKDDLEACLRAEISQCVAPECPAGTEAEVNACMRPYGSCIYTNARACTVKHLGEAALRR